jgi:hypothetical protein
MIMTAIVLSLLLGAWPVPKTGSCPSGYFQSGAYSMTDKAPRAISESRQLPEQLAAIGCVLHREPGGSAITSSLGLG